VSNLGPVEVVVLVMAAGFALVLFGIIVFALATLVRTLNSARAAIDDLHAAAIPLLNDAHDVVRQANSDLAKVDTLLTRADSISGTVDSASKLAYSLFSNPAVKALALASGGARAIGRLRRGRRRGLALGRGRAARRALDDGVHRLGSGDGE